MPVQDHSGALESTPGSGPATPLRRASRGQRFATLLLDLIFFNIFGFIVGAGAAIVGLGAALERIPELVLGVIVLIAYYVPQETNNGRTLGKLIMGTKAVAEDGRPISFAQAVGRTLCRFIPFEAFSFLVDGRPRGWHDSIPKTQVVSLKKS